MSSDQRLTLILAFVSLVGIPTLVFSFRLMGKWHRVEMRLEQLVDSMSKLVEDKDKVHTAMQSEIRDDRAATDRRLRWLEEHLWGKGRSPDG